MKTQFTRRKFLKTSTLAGVASFTAPRFFSSASAAGDADIDQHEFARKAEVGFQPTSN
jgi:hypothetical protein